jgi:hypothetical protein
MTLGQLILLLRWGVASALLLAGSVLGLFALLMLRDGIPRTEGSPAGAVIAAVLMAAIVTAPILLIAGAALCFKLSRLPWPRREARPALVEEVPVLRGEFWLKHANGAQLGALFNAGRAVLIWDAGTGQAAECTQGARPTPERATHHFVDAQDRLLQIPYGLTLPEALARREQECFKTSGERSDALDWTVLKAALDRHEDAWELVALAHPRRMSRVEPSSG